jgi:hypothetical protein
MFFIVRYKLGYYKVIQQNSEGYKQIGRECKQNRCTLGLAVAVAAADAQTVIFWI